MDNLLIEGWEDEEYKAFVNKFKTKKTTDDCYTPENVFAVVEDFVCRRYGLQKKDFFRPFWPGGDYEAEEYLPNYIVVDNPPFSILTKICRFYLQRGIRFFLFAPTLTLFSGALPCCAIPCGVPIQYANTAEVNTSFLTNLEPADLRVKTYPDLYQAIFDADAKNRTNVAANLPKYRYPDNILTASMAAKFCKAGISYELSARSCRSISALDAQRNAGKKIFGSGFLLSTRAAAERAAAERAAAERAVILELSEAEQIMVQMIDKNERR